MSIDIPMFFITFFSWFYCSNKLLLLTCSCHVCNKQLHMHFIAFLDVCTCSCSAHLNFVFVFTLIIFQTVLFPYTTFLIFIYNCLLFFSTYFNQKLCCVCLLLLSYSFLIFIDVYLLYKIS